MAEASKAKLTTAVTMTAMIPESHCRPVTATTTSMMMMDVETEEASFPVSQQQQQQQQQLLNSTATSTNNDNEMTTTMATTSPQKSYVFTMDLNGNGKEGGGLQNIVRHFRSSCSSAGSVSTAVTANSTLTSRASKCSSSVMTVRGAHNTITQQQQQQHQSSDEDRVPVRVSFVPLDPGECVGGCFIPFHSFCLSRCWLLLCGRLNGLRIFSNTRSLASIFCLFSRHATGRSARRKDRCHSSQAHGRHSLSLANGNNHNHTGRGTRCTADCRDSARGSAHQFSKGASGMLPGR